MSNTSTQTPQPAQWSDYDAEFDFSLEALRSHLAYAEQLTNRAEYLAKLCLNDNLFDQTLLPPGPLSAGARSEKTWEFWKGCHPSLLGPAGQHSATDLGTMEFELSVYIGCGDYETCTLTLPARALTEDLESFLSERRARRDAFYESALQAHDRLAHQQAQADRAKKQALLNQLKAELGENQ